MENSFTTEVRDHAIKLGFSACGFARVTELSEQREYIAEWLSHGRNADMQYMGNHFDMRLNPELLVEDACSVVSVLLNYYPNQKQDKDAPVIAKYAWGLDYHKVLKDRLFQLLSFIKGKCPQVRGRAFVDSAPVLERAWAVKAGLGWIGKNTNLISPGKGSFFFIGELILNIGFEYDFPIRKDYCGKCTRCIDSCPTGALIGPRKLNAERCISYQTIENRKDISPSLKGKMNNQLFGCDLCQDVCPWNSKAIPGQIEELQPMPGIINRNRDEWSLLSKEEFDRQYKGSSLERAGYNGIKRNLDFISG